MALMEAAASIELCLLFLYKANRYNVLELCILVLTRETHERLGSPLSPTRAPYRAHQEATKREVTKKLTKRAKSTQRASRRMGASAASRQR